MPTKKKTDTPDLIPDAEENNELISLDEQTETIDSDLQLDSVEDNLKDSDEQIEIYNELELSSETETGENDEPLRPEEQVSSEDVDINELLSYMDSDDDSGETDEFNDDTEDNESSDSDTEKSSESNQIKTKRILHKEHDTKSESESVNTVNPFSQNAFYMQPTKRNARNTGIPPVLTIESKAEVETKESIEETAWHEIRNAYRTRRILTGYIDGVEQTEVGKTVVIVNYNDFRVIIPMKEMMLGSGRSPSGNDYGELMRRQNKIASSMLGAQIDFIVKGIETKTRSIVASRKDAMLKKRQTFYMSTDASGKYRICDGRVVQARVIAVAEKVVRIEAFGVECSMLARDLSWDWFGDAHERFNVGDEILVRILNVNRDSLEDISIKADMRSVSDGTNQENLKKCRIQSKYAGTVTDVHNGAVYIRLSNGANAVAHSCYDRRMPGKTDIVSFAITHIDEERNVAFGVITRIIKQNL